MVPEETPEEEIAFDKCIPYRDAPTYIEEAIHRGKRFEVCTVRQKKLADLPLGNLFWLLKAALAKSQGAQVVVTDFYDNRKTPNESVVELMRILGLNREEQEEKNATLRKAEDVERNMDFWSRFCTYVREHREEQETWETIGTVKEGILAVLDAEEGAETVPESMQRFLEEMSVWVEAIDEDAVQVLHHEKENTQWVRRLYPEAKKRFVQVELPFKNEYRGKYKEDKDGVAVIHQRRFQDLSSKLAQTEEDFTEDEDPKFYEFLFQELITVLNRKNERIGSNDPLEYQYNPEVLHDTDVNLVPRAWLQAYPNHPEAENIRKMLQSEISVETMRDLVALDPSLLPFYLDTLTSASNDETEEEGRARLKDEEQEERYFEGLLLLNKRQRKKGGSLTRITSGLSQLSQTGREKIFTNPKLRDLSLSTEVSTAELGEFWMSLFGDPELIRDPRLYTHPAVDRLAKELGPDDPAWSALKGKYFELMCEDLPAMVGFACPLIKRLLTEWSREEGGAPFRTIISAQRSKADRDYYQNVFIRESDANKRNRFKKHFESLLGVSLGEDFPR